jgi:N4-gp56 family major capsid protein
MLTNFNALTDEQKTAWSMDTWRMARNFSFANKFMGTESNSMIQVIDELTEDERGSRAVITMVADTEGDGVAGDRTLEGNEEEIKSFDEVIQIDQLRNAHRHKGRMAEQSSVVRFRKEARNNLAYWMGDRMDQLAFLTLAGFSYSLHTNGRTRVGSEFNFLNYATDVSAPTAKRALNYVANVLTEGGTTGAVAAGQTPDWEMFVQTRAYMKDQYIRGVRTEGGEEYYYVFMTPQAIARLKLDSTYMSNLREARERAKTNPLFTGAVAVIDGLIIHEYRHVPNCAGATSGVDQWGAGSNIIGSVNLFCGAQALGFADIGEANWEEKGFDYENQQGIAVGKIFGFLKPTFESMYANNTDQDFGVVSVYTSYV